jgi:hypothetical protein
MRATAAHPDGDCNFVTHGILRANNRLLDDLRGPAPASSIFPSDGKRDFRYRPGWPERPEDAGT